jgi:hypothetical protein
MLLAWIALALLAVAQSPPQAAAPPSADREAIVAVVQKFFDAIAQRDPAIARQVMLAEGQVVAVSDQNGTPVPRARTAQQFADGLANATGDSLERMWNPDVRVQGGIGTLWTRYDFHRGGTFSHCGVDAFNLVKTADGWRIASVMYTIERTNCPPSPLGPPKK